MQQYWVKISKLLLQEAHRALAWGVEQLSDDLRQISSPGDFAQRCCEAVSTQRFIWSLPLFI